MKVITKLLLTIETDVETGDIKLLNREVINDDIKPAKKKSASSKIEENPEPIVRLADNKLTLTTGAMELLKVAPDDKVDVKYNKENKPIIGSDEAFDISNIPLFTHRFTNAFIELSFAFIYIRFTMSILLFKAILIRILKIDKLFKISTLLYFLIFCYAPEE